MNTTQNESWNKIEKAGERVARSYAELVEAANDLAILIGYSEDDVLRRIFPKNLAERRDAKRIMDWLTIDRGLIETRLQARQIAGGGSAIEPFINKHEVARRLQKQLRTVDNWMSRGVLPYYKIGRSVSFKWSEIEAALKGNFRVARQ